MFNFRLGALGRAVSALGFAPAFSPASLFAAGEQGAWYDPSDLSTMFQDRAGTTPVTADGQTVGKILDKSGRGNHATALNDAARPLYKTDGTYHWLQFDGVDDNLSTAAVNFTATDKMSVFAGVRIVGSGTQIIQSSSSSNQHCMINTAFIANQPFHVQLSDGTTTAAIFQTTPIPVPKTAVVYMKYDYGGTTTIDELALKVNAVSAPATVGQAGPVVAAGFLNQPIFVGARHLNDLFLNGNIYSLIVRGALSAAQEITDTETWVNGKTGAY